MAEPKRRRKGILDTLTNADGGFSGANLEVISGQISQLQEKALVEPEAEAVPEPLEAARPPKARVLRPLPEESEAVPEKVPPVNQRRRGARDEKPSGYHLRLAQIKSQGLEHPLSSGNFTMTPHDDMLALLALEQLSVIQVVYLIMRETVGWEDPTTPSGRREWVALSPREIERRGIANRSQARRGLQRALDEGYLIRREAGNGYEYAIRWRAD